MKRFIIVYKGCMISNTVNKNLLNDYYRFLVILSSLLLEAWSALSKSNGLLRILFIIIIWMIFSVITQTTRFHSVLMYYSQLFHLLHYLSHSKHETFTQRCVNVGSLSQERTVHISKLGMWKLATTSILSTVHIYYIWISWILDCHTDMTLSLLMLQYPTDKVPLDIFFSSFRLLILYVHV